MSDSYSDTYAGNVAPSPAQQQVTVSRSTSWTVLSQLTVSRFTLWGVAPVTAPPPTTYRPDRGSTFRPAAAVTYRP